MRTFVTIVGIVLSVAMFTAVTEAVASLRGYLIDDVKNSLGGFYASTEEIDALSLSELKDAPGVEKTVTLGSVGYADIGSQNPYKPYLFVADMSAGFSELVAVNLESSTSARTGGRNCPAYSSFDKRKCGVQHRRYADASHRRAYVGRLQA